MRSKKFWGLVVLVLAIGACEPVPSAMRNIDTQVPTNSPLDLNVIATPELLTEPDITVTPLITSAPTNAASFPDPSDYEWKLVADGLERPLDMVSSRDGSGRLFIVEQTGKIWILQRDSLEPQPFLDLGSRISNIDRNESEQGLLGLAFPPDFEASQTFYVNYTNQRGDTVIARYRLSDNPQIASPESEEILLQIPQPRANHNGGHMQFGPDGFLYVSIGDGGGSGDPGENAQNTNTLLGTLLRLDVNTSNGYRIPEDNPFIQEGGRPEIWAYGLRNAWKFSFDQLTGDLYIADVGQDSWEEINYLPSGSPGGFNFGWDYFEGSYPYQGTPPENIIMIDPVFEYDHSQGESITGGFVYRGSSLPEFYGVYFFGDFISGRIWGMLPGEDYCRAVEELFQTGSYISSFGEDENGELYFSDLAQGAIYRLEKKD